MTQREQVSFRAAEGDGGTRISIVVEPSGRRVVMIGGGFFGFDLGADATYEEAVEFAALLNERIKAMTFDADFMSYGYTPDDNEELPPVAC